MTTPFHRNSFPRASINLVQCHPLHRRPSARGQGFPGGIWSDFMVPILVGLGIYASTPTVALAANEETTWYQVEVIVFSQQDIFREEANRRDVELKYPENLVQLEGMESDRGKAEPPLYALLVEKPVPIEQMLTSVSSTEVPEEPAYVSLPSSERTLNAEAYSLNRSGVYKVLFHQAWRQPGLDENQSPWVYVKGGGSFEKHHELEGSLRLIKARYLHIQANLWRTVFDYAIPDPLDAEDTDTAWAVLPTPPEAAEDPRAEKLVRLVAGRKQAIKDVEKMLWNPVYGFEPVLTEEDAARLLSDEAGDQELDVMEQGAQDGDIIGTESLDSGDLDSARLPSEDMPAEPAPPRYSVIDLDFLQQSQRVDTGNLFYFDHPRIGIIASVSEHKLPVASDPSHGDNGALPQD